MIRSGEVAKLDGLDNLQAFMEAFPGLFEESVADTFNTHIKPDLLDELRYYPGLAKHPFVFATPKSRRWYFYAIHVGIIPTSNGRYQRTGGLAAAWKANVIIGDGSVVLAVTNKNRAVKYITGKRQVPGHKNTGWPRHDETIDFWRDETKKELDARVLKLIRGNR